MLFSILLIATSSLFINALPADGSIPSPGKLVQALSKNYRDVFCTGRGGGIKSITITRDVCSPFYAVIPPTAALDYREEYISGQITGGDIQNANLSCKAYWYRGLKCLGSVIGNSQAIQRGYDPGYCVNLDIHAESPPVLDYSNPLNVQGANSVKMICTEEISMG